MPGDFHKRLLEFSRQATYLGFLIEGQVRQRAGPPKRSSSSNTLHRACCKTFNIFQSLYYLVLRFEMAASEISSTDVVVLILGAPSAGKSTLVNKTVGADVATLEMAYHGTSEVKSYFLDMEVDGIQKRIALVDTPGLLGDDGEGTDHIKVVRGISDFLANL
ncbi:hypothetical protein BKA70DRAFT_3123 [Coprinopsis sp. MPI-PUGE-AT-0042]|nr:hypothetical protein BKA70DRAFT_3123 [Coprinopsis sp. MPI-PUGE-AT-0042]